MNKHHICRTIVAKRAIEAAGAIGILFLFVIVADAGTIDALSLFTVGPNNLTDASGECLINGGIDPITGKPTDVARGSILLSAFAETQLDGSNYGPPQQTQLAGVAALECLSATNVGTVTDPVYLYKFGPATSSADLTAIKGVSQTAYNIMSNPSLWSAGTMMAVYDNATAFKYQNDALLTIDQSIGSASSGTEVWQFGYTGPLNGSGESTAAVGQGWTADGLTTNNFSSVGAGNIDIAVNFSLSMLSNNSGLMIAADQTTPVTVYSEMGTGVSNIIALTGGSTIGAGFANSPWPAADTGTTANLDVVPEPSSVLLLGTFVGVLALV